MGDRAFNLDRCKLAAETGAFSEAELDAYREQLRAGVDPLRVAKRMEVAIRARRESPYHWLVQDWISRSEYDAKADPPAIKEWRDGRWVTVRYMVWSGGNPETHADGKTWVHLYGDERPIPYDKNNVMHRVGRWVDPLAKKKRGASRPREANDRT